MYQHDAHLANIVTSYCTCLGGIMPMLYCLFTRVQPMRWFWVYFCVFLTGVPTVWLHAVEGNRVASFFDTGSNILLAWVIIVAITGDYMAPSPRKKILTVTLLFNVLVWAWLIYEIFAEEKKPLLRMYSTGNFYTGEVALIINSLIAAFVFVLYRHRIHAAAKPFLYLTLAIFLFGLVLATGDNDFITWYIVPWHAAWHIVGAFGFITLWFFNHIRFTEGLQYQ